MNTKKCKKRKCERQIEAMTHRLVTCPLSEFDRVQKELFRLQAQLRVSQIEKIRKVA